MEKKNKSNGMVDLFPREIILDILSRLPSEAVLQCKLVCKSWRNLLRSCDAYRRFQLYYGEYTCNSNANTINTVVQIHHPPCSFFGFVLGSCNGLILSCQPNTCADKQKNLYLSNPMKREYLNLPIQEEPTVCGFGYDTSAGVYKVVRMDPDRVTRGDMVHVYTVGSGVGWRRKENIAQMRCSRFGGFTGIPCNGALHWLDYKNRIWTFDLADEEFRCIPSPQFQLAAVNDHFELRLLGECLSLVHYKDSRTILDIWLLKRNDKERKRNNSTVNEKLDYYKLSSWNWSKEFSLTEVLCEHYDPVDIVDPFALTKNGELLLFSRTTTEVYHYTMKSTKSVYDKEKLNDGAHVRLYVRTAMPYKKSFVSLKDLGEDVKIFDLVTR